MCLHVRYGLKTQSLGLLLAFAVCGALAIQVHDIVRRIKGPGGLEIETAVDRINKAADDAMLKLAEQVSAHSKKISQLIDQAQEQEKRLQEAIIMAAPPVFSLAEPARIERTEGGYKVTLTFRPSKNQQLGLVLFTAEVAKDTDTAITAFASASGPIRGTGKGEIDLGGKTARLSFSPIGFAFPRVELHLSGAARVRVFGNYLPEPLDLDVR